MLDAADQGLKLMSPPTVSRRARAADADGDRAVKRELGTLERMYAACVGSGLVALTMTPLDVAKVRQQATGGSVNREWCGVHQSHCFAANPKCPDFFISDGIQEHRELKRNWSRWWRCAPQNSVRTILSDTFAQEGLRGLYAGFVPTLVMSVPNNVLYFAAYEHLRDRLQADGSVLPDAYRPLAPVVAGSSARCITTAVTSPIENVRTRVQAGVTLANVRASVAEAGVLTLWKGAVPTLWRDVPFSAIYWFMYERVKRQLDTQNPSGSRSIGLNAFAAGAAAGSVAAVATMPFDVVKTRVQVESSSTAASSARPALLPSLLSQARQEGVASLFTGIVPRILRTGPSCAIMIGAYETTKLYLNDT
eukprot:TRINITY_DN30197_c0_g1_i1.p1 TRINITY_DN30197_c0_g1~~TRINITY_DN30197_c0_g1_i1.p1  ORF type:complete len:364 (+),score=84.52 TRINITY_DN30197_c0_g1_i1:64-1155(+)